MTTTTVGLIDQVKLVIQLRRQYEDSSLVLAEARRLWEEEHRSLLTAVKANEILLRDQEGKLRDLAVAATGGERGKPSPGLEVKKVRHFNYTDEEAMAWCREQAPFALSLNEKAFLALCKNAATVPPCVETRDLPVAYIARDLAGALAKGGGSVEDGEPEENDDDVPF